ncbi:MAG: hypothetical protein DME20_05835 [Verrucomicrobia bacterium]|nr:MAG: hypothetical protein DME20_05835 [Verrucomicrobiota bacterium]
MRFYTKMKKNGQVSTGRRVMDYAVRAMDKTELYCTAHPGSPSAVRRPRLFFRGELWIALVGPSVEEGIVGIGPTVAAALRAFDMQYLAGLHPAVESVGEVGALCQLPKAFGERSVPIVIPKPTQNLAQKFQVLHGHRSGLFEPYEQFGS